MAVLQVVLVDSYRVFRDDAALVLGGQRDIQVVGELSDAVEAVWMARALSPHVILIDAILPGVGGIELARAIMRRDPHVAVVIVASHIDEDLLFDAVKAGVAAFVTRDIGRDELVMVVRRVGRGEYPINDTVVSNPSVISRVLEQFRDLELADDEGGLFVSLSPREVEVLDCIGRGMSNKEIARLLLVSDQTVKNHITSILRKLAVNDRTQAVICALRRGWIQMPPELK